MKKQKLLIGLALVVLPGLAVAQTVMRPTILTKPQSVPAASEMTPEWVKEMNSLKQRVSTLEGQLNQTRQELAGFKAEYATHTHRGYYTSVKWENHDCESYDHAGVDDPDFWECSHMVGVSQLPRASGKPIQAAPGADLGN